MGIKEIINERILFFDGGMGTMLQKNGLPTGELPEIWNITKPDIITEIHKEYILSGSDVVSTNTFGANGIKFDGSNGYFLKDIVYAALKNARKAVELSKKEAFVALDIGPTGKLLKPIGDLDFEQAYNIFKDIIDIGKELSDLIIIETMSDSYEAKAAILAAKENCDIPVFCTVTFDENQKLLTGGGVMGTVAMLEGLGVDALGVNCGMGARQMESIVNELLKYSSVPVIVNPNAGIPRSENGKTVYDVDEKEFADIMTEFVKKGVRVVGGCCGTTPLHISTLKKNIGNFTPKAISAKNYTIVSSFASSVDISKEPVIIGERINPTGKKLFKKALKENDISYILSEAVKQRESGAHILDVNVGIPDIDEPKVMENVIKEVQSVCDAPLQIDTSDIEAMSRAMRIYNGKPMINSVNGKQSVMESIFPLVKKYGGVVVGLTLDENGIPDTAEGRLEIAKKIVSKAAEYGINKKDIVIDTLVMAVSSIPDAAETTLNALKLVKNELGVNTVLGVSNVSFGLPNREIINASFLTMALKYGLDAAIINPNSEIMKNFYLSYRVLSQIDKNCMDFINGASYNYNKNKSNTDSDTMSLYSAVEHGLKEKAAFITLKELESREPLEIINNSLIPALNSVGDSFEKGKLFLPQLLMSADAAKSSFDIIKKHILKTGAKQDKKGKVILATVKGDIHDIGKNIVKVLLDNYCYDVIDLGKDVPPENIVNTAEKENVKLVGLSALMTTTVSSMEETIKLLKQRLPECKVMVGGAVLTEDYAKSIGADMYCKDAMASVHYTELILG